MNQAILGAGRIAGTMAKTVNQMDEVNLYAVASRSLERAKDFAKEKGVLVTEAMRVRYMPMTKILKDILALGRIGAVVGLTANLGYSVMHKERIVRPELGGGALLDLGVHTLNFATTVLGDYR